MTRQFTWFLAVLLLACAAPGASRAGELGDDDWKEAAKQARKLMKRTATWDEKILKVWDNKESPRMNAVEQDKLRREKYRVIESLGKDNSRRGAELLVEWILTSLELQKKKIAKEVAATQKVYEKIEKRARKAEGVTKKRFPPKTWKSKNNKEFWLKAKGPFDTAVENHHVEDGVRFMIGEAFRGVNAPDAVAYLVEEGLEQVQKVKDSEEVQVPIAKCLLSQDKKIAGPLALRMAKDASLPKLRILGLNWIGRNQAPEGFQCVVGAFAAPETAVRRAAVMAAHALDDLRAVQPLIESMPLAEGLLVEEIEDALHYFTGRSFEGSASVWARWWKDEGAKWFAEQSQGPRTRHGKKRREVKQGGTQVKFYGIPTESNHVVFVVDRSGSMDKPAGAKSQKKKADEETPKGPVTGGDHGKKGGKKGGSGGEPIAGDTKMEVAINQLKLSIDELQKDVKFAVVFYSNDIVVWKQPPELMDATKANKNDAKKWAEGIGAEGPTNIFGALKKALEYADALGAGKKTKVRTGADTIFLLTDGSPTTKDGELLSKEQKEQALKEFLDSNKLYHCIVHAIGIGPEVDRILLRKIASATGGEYKNVGGD